MPTQYMVKLDLVVEMTSYDELPPEYADVSDFKCSS